MRRIVPLALLYGSFIASQANALNQIRVADIKFFPAADKEQQSIIRAIAEVRHKTSVGSGTFISPYHLLTAQHITYDTPCENIQIRTLVKFDNRTEGPTFRCSKKIFEDSEMDIALLQTKGPESRDTLPSTHFVKIASEDIVTEKDVLDAYGYLGVGGTFLAHSQACQVLEAKQTAGIERRNDPSGPKLAKYMMNVNCMGGRGMSGGPALIMKKDEWLLVGVRSGHRISEQTNGPTGIASYGRLYDAIQKYPDAFKEVQEMIQRLRARARIISHLGHRILGSSLNDFDSQNPRHIDGYASDFAQSARPNLTPSCAPKYEIILARALNGRTQ